MPRRSHYERSCNQNSSRRIRCPGIHGAGTGCGAGLGQSTASINVSRAALFLPDRALSTCAMLRHHHVEIVVRSRFWGGRLCEGSANACYLGPPRRTIWTCRSASQAIYLTQASANVQPSSGQKGRMLWCSAGCCCLLIRDTTRSLIHYSHT